MVHEYRIECMKVQTRIEVLREQLAEQTKKNQETNVKQKELVTIVRTEFKKLASQEKQKEKEAEWELLEQAGDIEVFIEKVIEDLVKEYNEKIIELNEQIKQIEHERSVTAKELGLSKKREQDLEDEVISLTKELNKLQAEHVERVQKLNSGSGNKEQLRAEIDEKNEQLEEIYKKFDQKSQQNEELKAYVNELSQKLADQGRADAHYIKLC